MSMIVIMPGGFHPFHAGHYALYQSAKKAFPDAEIYVAATNDQSERPFPFSLKEKLAKLAGVEPGHFVQVKSPFQAREITQNYDPETDVLVFVRSEKDRKEAPQPGGTKKDGSPAYFQPYTGKDLQPFNKHAYIAYLPTVEFGPGITSATQIRKAWPTLNDKRKTALVMSLYPAAQKNPKLAQNVVQMFDQVMGSQESVEEGLAKGQAAWKKEMMAKGAVKFWRDKHGDGIVDRIVAYDKNGEVVGGFNRKGVAEGSLNEGQYEMMLRNGQVKKFVAKDDIDAKRIAAGHGAKSVIKLKGGVPAGKVAEQGMEEVVHESQDYLDEK